MQNQVLIVMPRHVHQKEVPTSAERMTVRVPHTMDGLPHTMTTSLGREIVCYDEVGWTNGGGFDCQMYLKQALCERGSIAPHAAWLSGAANRFPETACCACGRWRLPSANTTAPLVVASSLSPATSLSATPATPASAGE